MITGKIIGTSVLGVELVIAERDSGIQQLYYPAYVINELELKHKAVHEQTRSENVDLMDKVNVLNNVNNHLRKQNESLLKQNKKLRAEVTNLKSLLPTDD